MTISPFDHPVMSALIGDDDVAAQFQFPAELAAMLLFESALAHAEAETGLIPAEAAEAIRQACAQFEPDMQDLRAGMARDGLIVPALVAQLRRAVGAPHDEHVHKGATSQDVIDTALVLRLKTIVPLLRQRLLQLVAQIDGLADRFGANALMGRTRMQRALPIKVADRLAAWRGPVWRHAARLEAIAPDLLALQFGGAVGTLSALQEKGRTVAEALGRTLGLQVPERCWHTERDHLGDFASLLSLITGATGRIGQDIALMAQNEISAVTLASGGSSSAMPHKQNPVSAEVLISLARFNAAQLAAMHASLVHEQERSGTAWTLEWMVLPPMIVAASTSLRLASELLGKVTGMGDADL